MKGLNFVVNYLSGACWEATIAAGVEEEGREGDTTDSGTKCPPLPQKMSGKKGEREKRKVYFCFIGGGY